MTCKPCDKFRENAINKIGRIKASILNLAIVPALIAERLVLSLPPIPERKDLETAAERWRRHYARFICKVAMPYASEYEIERCVERVIRRLGL